MPISENDKLAIYNLVIQNLKDDGLYITSAQSQAKWVGPSRVSVNISASPFQTSGAYSPLEVIIKDIVAGLTNYYGTSGFGLSAIDFTVENGISATLTTIGILFNPDTLKINSAGQLDLNYSNLQDGQLVIISAGNLITSAVNTGTRDHSQLTNLYADDHSQYVTRNPLTDSRNVITGTTNTKLLSIIKDSLQTKNVFEVLSETSDPIFSVSADGSLNMYGGLVISGSSKNISFSDYSNHDITTPGTLRAIATELTLETTTDGIHFKPAGVENLTVTYNAVSAVNELVVESGMVRIQHFAGSSTRYVTADQYGILYATSAINSTSGIGIGTIGRIPKFTTSATMGDSIISEAGSVISIDGSTTIGTGSTSTYLSINGLSGTTRDIIFKSGGVNRWVIRTAGDTEVSGTDAGSTFQLISRDDVGGIIDIPLSIGRPTIEPVYINRKLIGSGDLILTGASKNLVFSNASTHIVSAAAQFRIIAATEMDLETDTDAIIFKPSGVRTFLVDSGVISAAGNLRLDNTSLRLNSLAGNSNRLVQTDSSGNVTSTLSAGYVVMAMDASSNVANGTLNYYSKFSQSRGIINSLIYDDGSNVYFTKSAGLDSVLFNVQNTGASQAVSRIVVSTGGVDTNVLSQATTQYSLTNNSIFWFVGTDASTSGFSIAGNVTGSFSTGRFLTIGLTGRTTLTGSLVTFGDLSATGTINFNSLSGAATRQLGVDSSGNLIVVGAVSASINGTVGKIPKFATTTSLSDSLLSEFGTTISADGNFTASGLIYAKGNLRVSTGNTNIVSGSVIGTINFYSEDSSIISTGNRGRIEVVNDYPDYWDGTIGRQDTRMTFYVATDGVELLALSLDSNRLATFSSSLNVSGATSLASTLVVGANKLTVNSSGRTIINSSSDHGETFQVDGNNWFNGAVAINSTLSAAGNTTLAGALNVSGATTISSDIIHTHTALVIKADTVDGSDNKYAQLAGGGAALFTRGGFVAAYGNEVAGSAGDVELAAGTVSGGSINFYTAGALVYTCGQDQIHTFGTAVLMSSTLNVSGAATIKGNTSILGIASIGAVLGGTSSVLDIRNPGTTGSNQYGITSQPSFTSAATNSAISIYSILNTTGPGTIPAGRAIYIDSPSLSTTTVSTLVGLEIANQSGGTINYAIKTGTGNVSFGDNVAITATGGGYWINSVGTYTYGMYQTGTSLAFRSGSTTPFLLVTSAGNATFAFDLYLNGASKNLVFSDASTHIVSAAAQFRIIAATEMDLETVTNSIVFKPAGIQTVIVDSGVVSAVGNLRLTNTTIRLNSLSGNSNRIVQVDSAGTMTATLSAGYVVMAMDASSNVANGTLNYYSKFSQSRGIINSLIYDDGSNVYLTRSGGLDSVLFSVQNTGASQAVSRIVVSTQGADVNVLSQATTQYTLANNSVFWFVGTDTTTSGFSIAGNATGSFSTGRFLTIGLTGRTTLTGSLVTLGALSATGTINFNSLSGTATRQLGVDATGNLTIVGAVSASINGTVGKIPKFATTTSLTDSLLTESGTNISAAGTVTIAESMNGFTIGNVTSKQRIQYATSDTTSFAFLTSANGYANLYAHNEILDGTLAVAGDISASSGIKIGSAGTGSISKIYSTAGGGTVIWSNTGTTYDFTLANNIGDNVMTVATSGAGVKFWGDVTLGGASKNIIFTDASYHIISAAQQLKIRSAWDTTIETVTNDILFRPAETLSLTVSTTAVTSIPVIVAFKGLAVSGGTASGNTAYGDIISNSTNGLVLIGRSGSSNDILIANHSGQTILNNPSSSIALQMPGAIWVQGKSVFADDVILSGSAKNLVFSHSSSTHILSGGNLRIRAADTLNIETDSCDIILKPYTTTVAAFSTPMSYIYTNLDLYGTTNLRSTLTVSGATSILSTINHAGVFVFSTTTYTFNANTADGSDTKRLVIAGAGVAGSVSRGAFGYFEGNEYSGAGGKVIIAAGDVATGTLELATGNQIARLTISQSGITSFSLTTDATTSTNASVTLAGGLGVTKAIRTASYFVSEITGNNQIVLNSTGANWGFISNPSSGMWSLGYGSTLTTLSAPIFNWTTERVLLSGGFVDHAIEVTTDYTITRTDSVIIADGSPGTYTITLPNAYGHRGQRHTIYRRDSSSTSYTTTQVLIATSASQTFKVFSGAFPLLGNVGATVFSVISDGNNWIIDKYSDVGTFVWTATGFSGVVSGSGRYEFGLFAMSLSIAPVTGTSNSTSFTITGLPYAAIPSNDLRIRCSVLDNSAYIGALAKIDTGGVMTLYTEGSTATRVTYNASGFTASGTKGLAQSGELFTIAYNWA